MYVQRRHPATTYHQTAAEVDYRDSTVIDRFLRTLADAPRLQIPRMAHPCIIWPGATDTTGYGKIKIDALRDNIRVHVLAYRHFRLDDGPLRAGLQINHRCDVRLCAEWRHLYAGTPYMNVSDYRTRGPSPYSREAAALRRGFRLGRL